MCPGAQPCSVLAGIIPFRWANFLLGYHLRRLVLLRSHRADVCLGLWCAPLLVQVQQEQVSGLVAHVVERQDALAAEVRSLRLQLQELLQTRNDFLWL